MNQQAGKIIIILGILVVAAGILVYFFGGRTTFLGRLPGDIRIEGKNSSFYFPLTTCILLSLALTVIVKIIQWLSR
jgi:hypothetical protein